METKTRPPRQEAALEVLRGTPLTTAAKRHGVDKGQLSRYVSYVRTKRGERPDALRGELEFWEDAEKAIDNDSNA